MLVEFDCHSGAFAGRSCRRSHPIDTPFEHGRTAVWVTQPADFVQLDGNSSWWNNVLPIDRHFESARKIAFQIPRCVLCNEEYWVDRSLTACPGRGDLSAGITNRIGPVTVRDYCSTLFSPACEALTAGQFPLDVGGATDTRVGRVEQTDWTV
ncbi:hypothetical protein CKO51_17055 [Rhodopirellula sp. SM50]|nr:hypothetical protein CKO51_17055 [Rhodopirellula sp. SM50]